ncbi:hypothetical protein TNCV_3403111 [Trichonephila clavipes]|nr:hypothetical protein TNCV_3403111 [Trichonephila clavipes]
MQPDRQRQIKTDDIHLGKGLVVPLLLPVALSTIKVTIRFGSILLQFCGTAQMDSGADCCNVGAESNSGEVMDVCKYILSLLQEVTLNIRPAEDCWRGAWSPDYLPGFSSRLAWNEPKLSVTCKLLKAAANDKQKKTSPFP